MLRPKTCNTITQDTSGDPTLIHKTSALSFFNHFCRPIKWQLPPAFWCCVRYLSKVVQAWRGGKPCFENWVKCANLLNENLDSFYFLVRILSLYSHLFILSLHCWCQQYACAVLILISPPLLLFYSFFLRKTWQDDRFGFTSTANKDLRPVYL